MNIQLCVYTGFISHTGDRAQMITKHVVRFALPLACYSHNKMDVTKCYVAGKNAFVQTMRCANGIGYIIIS